MAPAIAPRSVLTTPKEPNFFNDQWHRGVGWYQRLFAAASGIPVRGEASVRYTSYPQDPQCPRRIASVVPEVRLLFVVREPVARIRSHYLHEVAALRERRPIQQAIRELPVVVRQGIKLAMRSGVYRHVPQLAKDAAWVTSKGRSRPIPDAIVPQELEAELRATLADELRRLNDLAGQRLFPERPEV